MQELDIGLHKALVKLSDTSGGFNDYVIYIRVTRDKDVNQTESSGFNLTIKIDNGDAEKTREYDEYENMKRAERTEADVSEFEIQFFKGKFYSNGTV